MRCFQLQKAGPHPRALAQHLEIHLGRPAMVLGASLPIALELVRQVPDRVAAMVLFGPLAWAVMGQESSVLVRRILWNG